MSYTTYNHKGLINEVLQRQLSFWQDLLQSTSEALLIVDDSTPFLLPNLQGFGFVLWCSIKSWDVNLL